MTSLTESMIELVIDGQSSSDVLKSILVSFNKKCIQEIGGDPSEDFLKSVNTLVKFNDGNWKTEKQGYFLLKKGKNISSFVEKSEPFKKAVTIAKNMGYEHKKNSIVVLDMVKLKGFGIKTASKIRWQGFFTILDSGGVAYHSKVRVDHPKVGVDATAKLNLSKIETKFTRDKDSVPDIVVPEFFAKKVVDKELLSRVQKAIDKVSQSKEFSTRDIDILKSFKEQVSKGNKLSPKQLVILDKFFEEKVDLGVGSKNEWDTNFNDIMKFVKKLGNMMYVNSSGLKDAGLDFDSFTKELSNIEKLYRSGNIVQEGMLGSSLSIILDRLFHSYFRQSKYLSVSELIAEVPSQIKKMSKAKKPTKKSVKIITDMRNLSELMNKISDSKVNKEIIGYLGESIRHYPFGR